MFTTKVITKNEILSKISQEDIFKKYLDIEPEFGKGFKNPLREDNHGDCYFYIDNKDMLKFHDIPRNWNWDCFNLVCNIFNCKFYESLKIIAQDFNLEKLSEDIELIRKRRVSKLNIKFEKKSIKIKIRKWYNKDLEYWKQFNITVKELNFFNIFPIELAYLNKICIYKYKNLKDLGYAFYLKNKNFKLYFPFRNKEVNNYPKFYHNCPTSIQGFHQLPRAGEYLIITKSMKDVISMFTFDIDAIANISESILIQENIMKNLQQRFKVIYTLFDKDRTGIRMTIKMRNIYNTIPLFIPSNTIFALKDEKDFSDILVKYNKKYILNLINKFKIWHNSKFSTEKKNSQNF